ncbi:beta-galactosidase [Aureibacillus halotolerans]|uniref:Beta-galactosidase GanA n=1 Tax=Aureibacillus halotolerans TaxID=1508390 RepID=A0A4R6U2T2_9BACI|nr:beta-galactosidase [Aureibacillus halotolerans]TDQ38695.1 beta-galactosidase GanA [Aureibacillus halotolerans]
MSILYFYDSAFPFEGERPKQQTIDAWRSAGTVASADELVAALESATVLVMTHGAYFPKNAWPSIKAHLRAGKGLVHIGGAPFKRPVTVTEDKWFTEREQTGYHQELNIQETHDVDPAPVHALVHNADWPQWEEVAAALDIQPTYNFTLHVTHAADVPAEMGSCGPMDAHISPLVKGVSSDNRFVSAPAVMLENTKGDFAGGRWVFVNQHVTERFWQKDLVAKIAAFAAKGVTEIWLKPNYASYYEGERPRLSLQLQDLRQDAHITEWTIDIDIKAEQSGQSWQTTYQTTADADISYESIPVPLDIKPGYYAIEAKAVSSEGDVRHFHQGFWGYDKALLEEGTPLKAGRDYFEKDGEPFPIVGMTYMTSDVARKFLFLPNAAAWFKDMAQMKNAGINYIRTGFWTAWRTAMFVDGHPSEETLRAFDAFILTAKRHDLEVTVNFFSFAPETWEGENPYLDPRSVEAQKRFIRSMVVRHKTTKNVQWDLINEPTMFDPKRIFEGPRSSHDRFEQAAYVDWLEERHGDINRLRERWNMTPEQLPTFASVKLPEPEDIPFGTTSILPKKGGQWLDYTLFTMEMHNRWARELTSSIKQAVPDQLVTVGQDEGLGSRRPSPFFYAEAVDYTTVHSWWYMDHLVWDSIFTKAPDKPNLVQETGIMYIERPDGRAKRSELELRNILERKYAYAFGAGGAGAVQWLWNVNHYMDNVNESNIGAIRSDGSEKPEANVSYDFGAFMPKVSHLLHDRKLEEVAVVYPYSNDFSNRPVAPAATKKLARLLTNQLRIPFRGVSEYHLDELSIDSPKVIIVPSTHNFDDTAYEKLIAHAEVHGSTILWTGPISLDAYWYPNDRAVDVIGESKPSNIRRGERLVLEEAVHSLTFSEDQSTNMNLIGKLETEMTADTQLSTGVAPIVKRIGNGKLVWCPLPVELNHQDAPVEKLYQLVFEDASVQSDLEWLQGNISGIYGRRQAYPEGDLLVFVSEDAFDTEVKVRHPEHQTEYAFTLESERTVMFALDRQGAVTAVYRPDEVEIHVNQLTK